MRRISLRFSIFFFVIMTGIKDRDRKRKAKRLNTLLLLILSAHICICEYNRQSAVTKKSFFFISVEVFYIINGWMVRSNKPITAYRYIGMLSHKIWIGMGSPCRKGKWRILAIWPPSILFFFSTKNPLVPKWNSFPCDYTPYQVTSIWEAYNIRGHWAHTQYPSYS